MKQLYLETFGCQMNVSDSEKIALLLQEVGYETTQDPALADLIILNTCSVRAKAEEKVYQHLHRFKALKKDGRFPLVGVGGCVAQQEGERLLKRIPHLDLVFGTHNLHRLPDMVLAAEEGERLAEVGFIDSETRRDLFPVNAAAGITRFVTIMQGCDNFCSYCVVPYVRGREVSRRAEDIIAEIEDMVTRGVREVTLLGQNVNSYGLKSPGEPDFSTLLRRLSTIEGLERIRFTTSHPKDISAPLISCFADLHKLCSHIHLPAQSGSDSVLAKMNRGYTRQQYVRIIEELRATRPDIQVTGDMIVGFPGETEADFQETLSLMETIRFSDLFAFVYSPRPETAAARLEDPVGKAEKKERLARLLELQRRITGQIDGSFVGSTQPVLVEGVSRRGDQLYGRTPGNRVVNFSGPETLTGRMVDVAILRANRNTLFGSLAR